MESFAEIIGSLGAAYLIVKILEWVLIKWIIKNYSLKVVVSSTIVLILFIMSDQYLKSTQVNHYSLIVPQFIACILLPVLRIMKNKFRRKKLEVS